MRITKLGQLFILVAFTALLLSSCAVKVDPAFTVEFLGSSSEVLTPDRPMIFKFSKPVDIHSIRHFLVIEPATRGEYTWDETRTQMTFTPAGALQIPKEYTVRMHPRLVSQEGYALSGTTMFTGFTASSAASIGPATPSLILSALTPQITLAFTERMDTARTLEGLSIQPAVEFVTRWTTATRLIIQPKGVFEPEQALTITLDGAKTEDGDELLKSSWTYTMESLKVQLSSSTDNRIIAKFNYPMDQAATEAAISLSPELDYKLLWTDTDQVTIELVGPVIPVSDVLVTVTTEAKSESGVKLALPARLTYTTLPLLKSVVELENKPGLIITFNYPVDAGEFERDLVFVPEVGYELVWGPENRRVGVNLIDLPYNSHVDVFFNEPVLDLYGNELGALEKQTVLTGPPLQFSEWYWNTVAAPYGSPFVITFLKPVDRDSVEQALEDQIETPISIEWTSDRHVSIEGEFDEATSFEVLLPTTVLTMDGRPLLGEPYSFRVSVQPRPRAYSFGVYGADVETVNLNSNRLVQISGPGSNYYYGVEPQEWDQPVTFDLMPITLDQYQDFLARESILSYTRLKFEWAHPDLQVIRSWQQTEEELLANLPNSPGAVQLPTGIPEGLYLLNMSTDIVNDQLVLNLTRASILVKEAVLSEGANQVFALVQDELGSPRAGWDVEIYDQEGEVIANGPTNSAGVFETSFTSSFPPAFAIASGPSGEWAMSGFGGDWASSYSFWSFGGRFFSTPVEYDYLGYLYTDRPIYQPGQTVNFKAILRRDNDASYSLPDLSQQLTLEVVDSKGNTIYQEAAALSTFGTADASYTLTESAMLGDYKVRLLVNGEVHSQAFSVQTYDKPDMTVSVSTDKTDYITNEPIRVTVDTQYLFGQPVANANVRIDMYHIVPGWEYGNPDFDIAENWVETQFESITVTTNSEGIGEAEIVAPTGRFNYYYYDYIEDNSSGMLAIEASFDDGSDQHVAGYTTIKVYPADLSLSLDTGSYVRQPGEVFVAEVEAQSVSGHSSSGTSYDVVIDQLRKEKSEYSGYYYSYFEYDRLTSEFDENSKSRFELSLPAGHYQIQVLTTDALGNRVAATEYVMVDEGVPYWWLEYDDAVSISVTNDQVFHDGDTARLEIFSALSGPAMLTVERGSVLEYRPVRLTAPLTYIDLPITDDFAPNVYVALHAWEPKDVYEIYAREVDNYFYDVVPDYELERASITLEVEDTAHQLIVEVTADQQDYFPRDEATFTITVTDYNGDPVDAEVSAALVDEAIYQLREELSLDIHEAFYQERENDVATSDSFSPSRVLVDNSGQGGGGDDGVVPTTNPRADFPDTAMWLPVLRTGDDGVIEVSVPLPDTLTSWRLSAKAVTLDSEIGQGQAVVTTTQPLLVRPLLPASLTSGDQVVLSSLVHNYSNSTLQVDVQADVLNLEIHGVNEQTIQIPAGESRIVNWLALVGDGDAQVTLVASSGTWQDAIITPIPVEPFVVTTSHFESGILEDSATLVYVDPEDALTASDLSLTISRSVSASLLDGSDYLTGFPYGCIEQTMSRALPNAVLARAYQQLGQAERISSAELQPKIEASIQRLYAMQHPDGGWGWWFDDDSHDYQTAWVVFGLSVMKDAGYDIDADVITEGIAYLQETLGTMNPSTQAYALYVMAIAGQGDLEKTEALTISWESLDGFGQTALAAAFYHLGHSVRARELITTISEGLVGDSDGTRLSGSSYDGYFNRKFLSSELRTTAFFLQNLILIDPEDENIPQIAQWLIRNKDGRGWRSTNETAYTILALSDYMLHEVTAGGEHSLEVHLNGSLYEEVVLEQGVEEQTIAFAPENLRPGENNVEVVRQSGEGELYYSLSGNTLLDATSIGPSGIEITRTYYDPETGEELTSFVEGQLVTVILNIRALSEASYVMIEDPLPAGVAAVNENLNNTGHDAVAEAINLYSELPWYRRSEQFGYNNKEIRPDRVVLFITDFQRGEHKFEYLVRATTPGRYQVKPPSIEAMYDPEWRGHGISSVVTVGVADKTSIENFFGFGSLIDAIRSFFELSD